MKCIRCQLDHNGTYGSGKYCSKKCYSKSLIKDNHKFTCKFCGKEYISYHLKTKYCSKI